MMNDELIEYYNTKTQDLVGNKFNSYEELYIMLNNLLEHNEKFFPPEMILSMSDNQKSLIFDINFGEAYIDVDEKNNIIQNIEVYSGE